MNIRYKLSIQFTIIVISILLIFTISIYYFSASYRTNDYYARLKDRANTTARLLLNVKEVDETLLKIIDRNTQALYQERIFIFDENNKLVYTSSEETFNNYNILEKIKEDEIYKFKQKERDAIGILYKYNSQNYIVIASAHDIYGIAKIKNLRIILVAAFLLSLAITIIAGLIFSGRALYPISTVVEQVKKISVSHLNLRVDEGNRKDEIAQLAITFNEMLQRLEEAFILQRDFVSNAAHELRTPFTVMLAEIEYCLMQEREKNHYLKTLGNLSSELKKLSKLSNGLLDLARISSDISNFELKSIRLDELIVDACNDVKSTYKDFILKPDLNDLPESELLLNILGNEQLMKIAIRNLIENACKFSNNKTVDIILSVDEKYLTIKFIDKGIGIPAEDISNIFQPFYRGNNSRFIAGFGLGLSLTMKIIQLHNGYLTVKSELAKGSEFKVLLPNKLNF